MGPASSGACAHLLEKLLADLGERPAVRDEPLQ